MSELKPCPFCGGENIAVGSDKGTVYRHNTAFGDLTRSVPTVRWAYCVDCGCVAPAEKVNNFDGFYKPDEQEDALNRAISTWNRRAQSVNEPLTMEQLRNMDGEPVWLKDGIGEGWFLASAIVGEKIYFCEKSITVGEPITGCGKAWVAFAHKPGGEQE